MRRSTIFTVMLAASAAVFAACEPKVQEPVKPVSTPVQTSPSPTPSPNPSPTGSPGKAGTTPDVKKPDGKDVNKDIKPAATQSPKK